MLCERAPRRHALGFARGRGIAAMAIFDGRTAPFRRLHFRPMLIPRPRPSGGNLRVTTAPDVLEWLRVSARAENASVSDIVTRVLRDAMDAERAAYSPPAAPSSARAAAARAR